MRKVDDGEKKKKKIIIIIMTFIVATNVIASRPPERRPTGTPNARANNSTMNIATLSTRQWYRMLLEDRVLMSREDEHSVPKLLLAKYLGQS